MSRTCETCRFWCPPTQYSSAGECRRNPPVYYEMQGHETKRVWPQTVKKDWCGEHKPHKEPDQQAMDKKLESIPPGVGWKYGRPGL